jgi:DNA-binding Xre family transcriptional regulator
MQHQRGQKREVSYRWRLREVMAEHGIWATTDLAPLLRERGIDLSPSQVHRLVTGTPERLSLTVLAALCDIFSVEPDVLINTSATDVLRGRAATTARAGAEPAAGLARQPGQSGPANGGLRPVRARVTPADRPDRSDRSDRSGGN